MIFSAVPLAISFASWREIGIVLPVAGLYQSSWFPPSIFL
nr:MAG TPA: hypothetical protein [Caudoviricetes sp.]